MAKWSRLKPWKSSVEAQRQQELEANRPIDAYLRLWQAYGGQVPAGHWRNGNGDSFELIVNEQGETEKHDRPDLRQPVPGKAWQPLYIVASSI